MRRAEAVRRRAWRHAVALLVLAGLPMPGVAGETPATVPPRAVMQDARYALSLQPAPAPASRFVLGGEVPKRTSTSTPTAVDTDAAAGRDRFAWSLQPRSKGGAGCDGDVLLRDGFED